MNITVFLISLHVSVCSSFSLTRSFSCGEKWTTCRHLSRDGGIIDVEFSRDNNEPDKASSSERKKKYSSILEASLAMTPPELLTTVKFLDPDTKASIPCLMAFTLTTDSGTFVVGTPLHTQVSVLSEESPQYFIDPDAEKNLELLEMAAAKFMELNEVDESKVKFWKTPRTLTMEGDIDSVIGPWRLKEQPQDVVGDLFGEEEDGDAFLDEFFKRELGENYEEEFLIDDEQIDNQVREMMDMFNVPGLGTEQKDEAYEKIVGEIVDDARKLESGSLNFEVEESKETALRLVMFTGPDGKPYSLVKMLQPMILIAKEDDGLEPDQRMLISKKEAEVLIPLLETQFEQQLADAGYSIGSNI
jgi:hypothetical protein